LPLVLKSKVDGNVILFVVSGDKFFLVVIGSVVVRTSSRFLKLKDFLSEGLLRIFAKTTALSREVILPVVMRAVPGGWDPSLTLCHLIGETFLIKLVAREACGFPRGINNRNFVVVETENFWALDSCHGMNWQLVFRVDILCFAEHLILLEDHVSWLSKAALEH